jgi:hypothetical protein
MPHVSPEKFDEILARLSPEQICSVDSGRVQIGTVIDLAKLFALEHELSNSGFSVVDEANEDTDCLPDLSEGDMEETIPARSAASELKANRKTDGSSSSETKKTLALKLDEIANRLDRVEQMLDHETESQ